MKNKIFPKLAANNIKKNGKTYIPYILTCILTVAMYYIVKSLSLNPGLKEMVGSDTLSSMMQLTSQIIALFSCVFLFYSNSFLVKRRKKEFGVFNILGMEKKHLSKILGWETFYIMLISIMMGLVAGIVLDKLMFLVITKMIGAKVVLGFFISREVIFKLIVLFGVIFLMIYLNSVRLVYVANPIELLQGGNMGEQEPKTKWLMVVLGLACVASGYYISITTENPIASLSLFFVAVVLVIVGTYFLFTAGSIALLKTLRKNKAFYYKTRHFTSISGMIYRMKQNAVGLANICILSTMVLIMVSSTSSLMIGIEDIIHTRYPKEFSFYSMEDSFSENANNIELIKNIQKEEKFSIENEIQYTYLSFPMIRDGNQFNYTGNEISDIANMNELFFMTLSDYNTINNEKKALNKDEILVYSNRQKMEDKSLKIFNRSYEVKEYLDHFITNGNQAANISNGLVIVVRDMEELYQMHDLQKKELKDNARNIEVFYGFDTKEKQEEQIAFYNTVMKQMGENGSQGILESREESRQSFNGVYGGLFFMGIFMGVLFVIVTVLIIYYKQISEGYEDKERFAIMQKVGMSRSEVKASIHSQVLMVFFLPLIVAGIHVAAAFPLISRLVGLLNLTNTKLYVMCTVISYFVFAVMYIVIYGATAKVYYKIVER